VATFGRHRAVLPLTLVFDPASPYRRVRLNLAEDFAQLDPTATLEAVWKLRLRGRFEVGEMIFSDPIE
jgi:hypothetical protein